MKRITIFEILFKLEDHNDNEFNGVPIHAISPLNGSDTIRKSYMLFLQDLLFQTNVCYEKKKNPLEIACLT